MAREANEQLGREVHSNLSFLFSDYGGVLNPYPVKEPSPFDYAATRVTLPEFTFQFVKGRGALRVLVAPKHAPKELEDILIILSVIDESFERREFKSFADLKAVLEPGMKLLQEFLAPDRYPESVPRLANAREHDRAIIRQWQTEINRRLYPDK
jgi:hypothetical protein